MIKNLDFIYLYEAKLPPLLRYFHIQNISPTGWVTFRKKIKENSYKQSNCTYEYSVNYKDIKPLHEKEDPVPLKIMSYDIEASSSHGDFPLAKKTYRKMLGEIIEYWGKNRQRIKKMSLNEKDELFIRLVMMAFEFDEVDDANISKVFPKRPQNKAKLLSHIKKING